MIKKRPVTLLKKSKSKKASKGRKTPLETKRKKPLTNARLLELAAKRKPPQSWYDEDFDGI
jgi:hypothetical protein